MAGLWLSGIIVFGGLGLALAVIIALAVRESDYLPVWVPHGHGVGAFQWLLVDLLISFVCLHGWQRLYPFACVARFAIAYICYLNFNQAVRAEREASAARSVSSCLEFDITRHSLPA
jgi:hypothetical protein